jgi:hypothetical protein
MYKAAFEKKGFFFTHYQLDHNQSSTFGYKLELGKRMAL